MFSLQEADANAKTLIADQVPTKVLWFCGGHGLCGNNLADPTDGALIQQRTIQRLDRYVKGDQSVSTGPQFEFVDQRGQYFASNTYPVTAGDSVVASSAGGTLALVPLVGGSGLPLIPAGLKASNALNLTIPPATTTTYIVGAPRLTLTYSGTGVSRYVYAQLVDDTTGLVLGYQVTPIPVTLDGQGHTISIALEPVVQTLRTGETVTLQLVAEAGSYQELGPTLGELFSVGALNVSSMQLSLPTAKATAIYPESIDVASVA